MAKKGDGPAKRLEKYQAMRDFERTAEPAGATGEGDAADTAADGDGDAADDSALRYVVQRHRASRLHYDFRLEVDGVLASWAVPKGPTLDPKARRLAVHVEDHPLEYAEFEGVIGAGQYGGGDVIVWDRGTWRPVDTDDPAAAIDGGEIHFDLDGEKLAGRFVLVRTDKGPRASSGKEQWLMLHKNDDHAEPGWDAEDHPRSVKTGRTNDEVKADPDYEWHSDRPAAEATATYQGVDAFTPLVAAPVRSTFSLTRRLPIVLSTSFTELVLAHPFAQALGTQVQGVELVVGIVAVEGEAPTVVHHRDRHAVDEKACVLQQGADRRARAARTGWSRPR